MWDTIDSHTISISHYLVRNELLNASLSGKLRGKLRVTKKYVITAFKILFSRRKKKFAKIRQIILGFIDYYRGTYDKEGFANRFTNHLDDDCFKEEEIYCTKGSSL